MRLYLPVDLARVVLTAHLVEATHAADRVMLQGVTVAATGPAGVPVLVAGDGEAGVIPLTGLPRIDVERLRYVLSVLTGLDPKDPPAPDLNDVLRAPANAVQCFDAAGWAGGMARLVTTAVPDIVAAQGHRPIAATRKRLPRLLARAASRLRAQAGPPADRGLRADNVVTHALRRPYADFFAIEEYDLSHPRFADGAPLDVTRAVFVSTDAALVLPYDPVRDRVMLVEQVRSGPFARGDVAPWVMEPVAGLIDAGEDVETALRREAEEEAGLTLHRVEKIAEIYASPGASTEFFHLYVGLADLPGEAQGLGGLEDETEDIRSHILSFDRFRDALDARAYNVGPLVLMAHWLVRHRDRLRNAAA